MKDNLVEVQKKILNIVRKYFLKKNSPFLDKSYFAFYTNNEGNRYIKDKIYKFRINKIKEILSENINIFNNSNLKITSSCNNEKYFNNLVITWGNNISFDLNGSFYDKYFSTHSSSHQNTFWIILSDNKITNKNLDENIAIIHPHKNFTNYYKCFEIFILNFFYNICGQKKKVINKDLLISKCINNFILKKESLSKLKNLLMPYEGQPFQKIIFFKQKIQNKNLKTYGFDHSAPHSIATQLYYTIGSPDYLLVSGLSVKKSYSKFYNWPPKKIQLSYPARYKNFDKQNFLNMLFLPYDFTSSDKILESFIFFLKNRKNKSIKNFSINIHPEKKNNQRHILLKKKIEKIKKKYKKKFSRNSKNNLTIAIGFTTTPIVALEFNLSVLHICPNPDFDAYLNYFWPDIIIKKINKYCFLYSLKKTGLYLNFKNRNKVLELINDRKN
jgi:hypothetical protein